MQNDSTRNKKLFLMTLLPARLIIPESFGQLSKFR